MDLTKIINDLSIMQEKQRKLFKEKQNKKIELDFSSFFYDELHEAIPLAGNSLLQITMDGGSFMRICNLDFDFGSMESTPLEDRKKAVEVIMNEARKEKPGDYFFKEVFDENKCFREKDKLRALTNGETEKIIISKKVESDIFSSYLELFYFRMLSFFSLISKSELFEKSLPHLLKVIESKGTRAHYSNNTAFLSELLESVDKEKVDKVKNTLHVWY